jgi:DNA-binding transcriptional regulator/RsmH inhibitor MraZ
LSEFPLPKLPSKARIITPSKKKEQLIKSVTTPSPTIATPKVQKPISVFLTADEEDKSSLEARKSSLLERIRAKAAIKPVEDHSERNAAWQRGEWVISGLFLYSASLQN